MGLVVRSIGLARTAAKITLANLGYNMRYKYTQGER